MAVGSVHSALQSALLFAGFTAPPTPRIEALLQASARGSARDLDAASSSFATTVRELREAAGFGSSPPWHEPSAAKFPWSAALAAEAHTIQAELHACLRDDARPESATAWSGAEYAAIAPAWKFTHLWQNGQWLPEAAARFPRTVALLQELEASHGLRLNPMQNVACGFARQPRGTGIAPHCDGNLIGLTAHLGLQVPAASCWIQVGDERRSWQVGQLLLMDTTHTHSTHNGGECDRYILMLNVLRPEVGAAEVRQLHHYMHAPPVRLDALNPGWLRVPPLASDAHGVGGVVEAAGGDSEAPPPPPTAAAAAAALVCAPSAVDDAAGRVLIEPDGPWLPQRGRGEDAGLVQFEPLAGRRYRVASARAMQPRQWPASASLPCDALPAFAPGTLLRPCAAAIDAEGCLEWIAIPIEEAAGLLSASDERAEPASSVQPRDIPLTTLRAHLALIRAVAPSRVAARVRRRRHAAAGTAAGSRRRPPTRARRATADAGGFFGSASPLGAE